MMRPTSGDRQMSSAPTRIGRKTPARARVKGARRAERDGAGEPKDENERSPAYDARPFSRRPIGAGQRTI